MVSAALNEPECYTLTRPRGAKPWNVDWQSPFPLFGECELDGEEIWYSPEKPILYRKCESEDFGCVGRKLWKNQPNSSNLVVMNPIVKSLQVLKLNIDSIHPKYELVPFLLKRFLDVVKGFLEMAVLQNIRRRFSVFQPLVQRAVVVCAGELGRAPPSRARDLALGAHRVPLAD